jgi:hypothetical protein
MGPCAIATQCHSEKRNDEATFALLTPPLALLASLSCFTLRLKPRKTGNPEAATKPYKKEETKTPADKLTAKPTKFTIEAD